MYRRPAPEPEPDERCRTCGAGLEEECGHAGKWPRITGLSFGRACPPPGLIRRLIGMLTR